MIKGLKYFREFYEYEGDFINIDTEALLDTLPLNLRRIPALLDEDSYGFDGAYLDPARRFAIFVSVANNESELHFLISEELVNRYEVAIVRHVDYATAWTDEEKDFFKGLEIDV